ncbi:MAG: C40 family peptidase [Spirochaetes bacterium]|nr:C40 family peptidase [Spirochaetota bacterium]
MNYPLKRAALLAAVTTVVALTASVSRPQEPGSLRDRIVEGAKKHIGTRYRYGGTGGRGFDCSGFVARVYGEQGIRLPHSSKAQYECGEKIPLGRALPGDLVFFKIRGARISHVGIYLGEGKFIHAPSRGKRVSIADMTAPYWDKRFAGAVTCIGGDAP